MNTVNMRQGKNNRHCRRYHHGDLREALIKAGVEALNSIGPADLSLRHLARNLGVTPPAAYRHFRSKEALLSTIAEEGFRDLNARFIAAKTLTDAPALQLIEIGIAYVRFAKERPSLFRLMFGATGPSVEPGDHARRAFGTLRALAAEGKSQELDSKALRIETIRRWAVVHGFAMLLIDGRIDEPDQFDVLIRDILGPMIGAPSSI